MYKYILQTFHFLLSCLFSIFFIFLKSIILYFFNILQQNYYLMKLNVEIYKHTHLKQLM